jgi:hypothetical protein
MKMRRTVLILLALVAAGLLWYFAAGGKTPDGQSPLVRLTSSNFHELRDAFNAAAGAPRVIAMLSPT